jgi:hypothetical protein
MDKFEISYKDIELGEWFDETIYIKNLLDKKQIKEDLNKIACNLLYRINNARIEYNQMLHDIWLCSPDGSFAMRCKPTLDEYLPMIVLQDVIDGLVYEDRPINEFISILRDIHAEREEEFDANPLIASVKKLYGIINSSVCPNYKKYEHEQGKRLRKVA